MVTFWDLDSDELREEKNVNDCRIPSVASENSDIFRKIGIGIKIRIPKKLDQKLELLCAFRKFWNFFQSDPSEIGRAHV